MVYHRWGFCHTQRFIDIVFVLFVRPIARQHRPTACLCVHLGKENDLDALHNLSCEIIQHLEDKDDVFIPKYEEVFKEVLERYHDDFRKEGAHSYDYKMASKR